MKVKKIFIVSLFLLAILTLGAASAADDTAADDLAVEDAGDVDLEVPAGEEISTDSDTDDVAVGDNVTYEDSSDDVLGASPDEELSVGTVNPTYTFSIDLPKNVYNYPYVEYGQPILVSGDFGNATGTITFNVGRIAIDSVDLVDGKFNASVTNYTFPTSSSYLLFKFTYSGDDYYKSVTTSNNYVYTYLDDVYLSEEVIYVGQEQYLNIDLHNATGYVNITCNNVSSRQKLENGKLVYNVQGYTLGTNDVIFNYEGDGKYNPLSKTFTFTYSEKENPTIYSSVYKTADKNIVIINVPNARGNNVTVTINGKKEVHDLTNCMAQIDLDVSEVVTEINVTYDGDSRFNPATASGFLDLSAGIVTNETFAYYFNQANGGQLFDFIDDGMTLDFQGAVIDNPDSSQNIFLIINKPVNIISSTDDAYICFNSTGARFAVNNGGSGSNISGITFYNTKVQVANASHVVLDNIKYYIVGNSRIGSGTGSLVFRDNTTYLTLKNSYIYGEGTGSTTIFTLSWADYCTLDNNTWVKSGTTGPLVYYNYYNIPGISATDRMTINCYNNFTNSLVYGLNGESVTFNTGGSGHHNLFENNTVIKGSPSFTANSTLIGNVIDGGGVSGLADSIAYNNIVTAAVSVGANSIMYNNIAGTLSVGDNSIAYNNTASGEMTVRKGAEAFNNNVGGLTISGADALVHDNVINGTSSINANNAQLYDNTFIGDKTITFSSSANNVTFKNNNVTGNIAFQNKNAKNNVIVGNTIRTAADYAIDLKTFTDTGNNISGNVLNSAKGFGNDAINHADDTSLIIVGNSPNTAAEISISAKNINVGETAVLEITTNETSIASATVFLNGETYIVNLSNGKGSLEVENLTFGKYDVTVIANDLTYGAQNTTNFTVNKNRPPRIEIDAPAKTQWVDSNITVTIKRATGTVTLDINGTKINGQLVDGVISFAVPDLVPGSYDFNITYSGDYKYEGTQVNGTLTVVKNKKVIILAEDMIVDVVADKFTAKFTNYIGEAIANANVTITIGNAIYPLVTDANGTATADILLYRGQYDVKVAFKAVENEYDAATADYTILVVDSSIMNIVSVDGDGIITGSLTDAVGTPIANAAITATMNGVETNLTTDEAGLFKFQAQNGYKVDFEFYGDNITTLSSTSITLDNVAHVLKDAVINVSDVSSVAVDTAAGEKGKAYAFTLKDIQGNAIANKDVKVVLNGVVYNVKTDANGSASVALSLSAAKKYDLNVFFMGDDDYKGASATAKITVTKKKTTLKAAKTKYTFKVKAKSKVIKATLKTSNKYLKAGKKVTIKIKGKTYTAKTGKNGAIKLNLKSLKKKGTYKAKIKFAGDSTYKASSSKTIKIVIK